MTELTKLAEDNWSRMFADCGMAAEWVELQRSYDPATGQLTEVEFSQGLQVLPQPEKAGRQPAAWADTPYMLRRFLVRERDLPPGARPETGRLRVEKTFYDVRDVERGAAGGVLVLICVTDRPCDSR